MVSPPRACEGVRAGEKHWTSLGLRLSPSQASSPTPPGLSPGRLRRGCLLSEPAARTNKKARPKAGLDVRYDNSLEGPAHRRRGVLIRARGVVEVWRVVLVVNVVIPHAQPEIGPEPELRPQVGVDPGAVQVGVGVGLREVVGHGRMGCHVVVGGEIEGGEPGLGLHPAEVEPQLHLVLLAVLRAGHQGVRFGGVVEHVTGVAILATHNRACSTIEYGYADRHIEVGIHPRICCVPVEGLGRRRPHGDERGVVLPRPVGEVAVVVVTVVVDVLPEDGGLAGRVAEPQVGACPTRSGGRGFGDPRLVELVVLRRLRVPRVRVGARHQGRAGAVDQAEGVADVGILEVRLELPAGGRSGAPADAEEVCGGGVLTGQDLVVFAIDGVVVPGETEGPRLAAEAVAEIGLRLEHVAVERRLPREVEGLSVDVLVGLARVRARDRGAIDDVDKDVVVVDRVDVAAPAQAPAVLPALGGRHDVARVVRLQVGVVVLGLRPHAVGGDGESADVVEDEVQPGLVLVGVRPHVGRNRADIRVVLHAVVEDRRLQFGVEIVVKRGLHRVGAVLQAAAGEGALHVAALPRHLGVEGAVRRLFVQRVRLALDVAGVAVRGGEGLAVAFALLFVELHAEGESSDARQLELGPAGEDRVGEVVLLVRVVVRVLDDLAVERRGFEIGHRIVAEPVDELLVAVVRAHHAFDVEIELAGVGVRTLEGAHEIQAAPVLVGRDGGVSGHTGRGVVVLGGHVRRTVDVGAEHTDFDVRLGVAFSGPVAGNRIRHGPEGVDPWPGIAERNRRRLALFLGETDHRRGKQGNDQRHTENCSDIHILPPHRTRP